MKTDIFLCTLIYFCQSIIPAGLQIPDPGIEKRDLGLQSLLASQP